MNYKIEKATIEDLDAIHKLIYDYGLEKKVLKDGMLIAILINMVKIIL